MAKEGPFIDEFDDAAIGHRYPVTRNRDVDFGDRVRTAERQQVLIVMLIEQNRRAFPHP